MYHELQLPGRPLCQSEPGYVRYILPQESFRLQMNWLRQSGWQGSSVGDAFRNVGKNRVAITFDDGCETDFIFAAPTIKDCGFGGTFYIVAGWVGRPGYLSPDQLRQLSSLGFEIGCHSMTHAYLNGLCETELQIEIGDAKKKIEDLIGKRVDHFSCPGGRYREETLAIAKRAGYRSVSTSEARANPLSRDLFVLGRTAILRGLTVAGFERICTGKSLRRMRMMDAARGAAKRLLGNSLYDRSRSILLREKQD
jgi:peptidoglycan/xylan/chitin deacetylase (PgdA/CDA1 family)